MLDPPLPEGISRRRSVSNVDSDSLNLPPPIRQRTMRWQPPPTVIIHFDGACRGNGTDSTLSSAACFVDSYDNTFSRARKTRDDTNQAAEISAAILAVETALDIANAFSTSNFTFCGDSEFVISAILSGRLLWFEPNKQFKNNAMWVRLRTLLDRLRDSGASCSWNWVPRIRNREADELCNAILDDRTPNSEIVSQMSTIPLSRQIVHQVIASILKYKRPTIRTLPLTLAKLWTSFILQILSLYPTDPILSRSLFWIAPHILSAAGTLLENRSDFKALRTHLVLLQNSDYLSNTLQIMADALPRSHSKSPVSVETRIRTLCSRGLFSKCIESSDTSIAPFSSKIADSMRAFFPEAPLPPTLLQKEGTEGLLTFGNISVAIHRSKRGKAPGISGWTRELIFPIFVDTPLLVQQHLTNIFNDILSVETLSPPERSLLSDGLLLPLRYDAKDKLRPIVIPDFFSKIIFSFFLHGIGDKDPLLANSGQAAFCPGASQTAVAAIAASLNAGHPVVSLDASNAFNTLSRSPCIDHCRAFPQYYSPLYPLINLLYCNTSLVHLYGNGERISIPVSLGTRQGCASATWWYAIGTLRTLSQFAGSIVSVVDDTYVVGRDSIVMSASVVTALESIGQSLNPSKCRLLLPPSAPTPSNIPSFIKQSAICRKPTFVLGALVAHSSSNSTVILNHAQPWLTKIRAKFDKLVALPTSIQNKLLILRTLSYHFVYAARTFHAPNVQSIFDYVDQLQLDTFCRITSLPKSDALYVCLFRPIEDRGIGLVPYSRISSSLHAQALHLATPFLQRLTLPIPQIDSCVLNSSIKILWRKLLEEQQRRKTPSVQVHNLHSWLSVWPINRFCVLSDEEVIFGLSLLLHRLPPRPYFCPFSSCQLANLSPEDYTEHILSCTHCGAPHFHVRHEKVNSVLHRTLRFHGMVSVINPKDLPLPNHSKGGADIMVYADKIFAVDVCICKDESANAQTNSMSMIANEKFRNYRQFKEQTGAEIIPFALSIYGEFSTYAIDALKYWSRYCHSNSLFHDAINHCQCELLRGLMFGVSLLHLKLNDSEQSLQNAALTNPSTHRSSSSSSLSNSQSNSTQQTSNTSPTNIAAAIAISNDAAVVRRAM